MNTSTWIKKTFDFVLLETGNVLEVDIQRLHVWGKFFPKKQGIYTYILVYTPSKLT